MIGKIIAAVMTNFGLAMFILAAILILINKFLSKQEMSGYEIAFRWFALLMFGLTAIYSFIMHGFFPDFTAATIGWQNSPFQYEVAMANLGFGMLGICSFAASAGFRLATLVGNTCWLWGDATGHIYQMITQHNFSVGNAGSWFWLDVLMPLIMMICYIGMPKEDN